jgi:hypothetical protein
MDKINSVFDVDAIKKETEQVRALVSTANNDVYIRMKCADIIAKIHAGKSIYGKQMQNECNALFNWIKEGK